MTEKSHRRLAILQGAIAPQHRCVDGAEQEKEAEEELMQVGDLAKRTKKTVRAIHLYEDMGLLRPVERTAGRFRLYNRESIERVRWISKMQAAGFSLPELKDLLAHQEQAKTGKDAALVLRGAYLEKLNKVQDKLQELHRLEQELLASLTYLDACQSACDDGAHQDACPDCSRHIDQPEPPALVTGAHVR